MQAPEYVAAAARRYAETFSAGDRESWLGCLTEDVELIEPADALPRRGRAVFAGIFDAVESSGRRITLEPIRIIANGKWAAVHMSVRVLLPDARVMENSVIEIFEVSDDGHIERIRTFLDGPVSGAHP
ncbi:nuclear transport factor 2 family protein [Paraburkholderia ferrariae]|uniref:nuclear transport factor 2 family protein n=1 Tax=Paraburkholderia ferrariae TaxID=386056 RepID=UPI00048669AD|nr:nuclear transport factor 2 family protein [Paraburkholderia ferrariae]